MNRALIRGAVVTAVAAGVAVLSATPASAETTPGASSTDHVISHVSYPVDGYTLSCGDHLLSATGGDQEQLIEMQTDGQGGVHYTQVTVWQDVTMTDELGRNYVIRGTSHAHDLGRGIVYTGSSSDVFNVLWADDGGIAGQVKIWSTYGYDYTTGVATQSYSDKGTCSGFDWP